ncbi:MAG: tripartite tricarboxylate transporter TctB family protein [Proteobacteria bacterium]|nr:tripartite tricarboxylate transporter TctB family protein [Pseudomonadota bacterium]MBU2228083.1 tripartite tricarboxylate transporter TctB family protein [Pseudomonadota bacterium]MBU2261886.1 tripartite tricarboxylate transporter TctB family protein [Pseudomonadota bacterium]
MRKPGEIVVGLCFLVIGICFTAGAVKLQIGVPTEPQPGFFPFVDGVILIALSSLFLFRAWGGRAGDSHAFGRIKGPAAVVLALVLYVATLERLGYVITTGLLSAVVLKVMETRPRVLVLVSLSLTVISYLVFDRLLGVTLPPGILTAFL